MRAFCFALLDSLTPSALASPISVRESGNGPSSISLAELALQKVLTGASPIFGGSEANGTSTKTSIWMKNYPDSTKLDHMNIPGTHDSATWNYSIATQDTLLHVTDLARSAW